MKCLGGMKPYKPEAFCLGKTLNEIFPNETKNNSMWLRHIETVLMNKYNWEYFVYSLDGTKYVARMAYLREGVVLAVVQCPN